jgi:C_GCAxxG_C_C family probable redox protein
MDIPAKKESRAVFAAREFDGGYNCAQSVLVSFQAETGLDTHNLLSIAAGFGGGMARQQMTCGAVTGAYMVIGLLQGKRSKVIPELKADSARLIKLFSAEFKSRHRSLLCRDLLGYDMNTPEGQFEIDRQNLYTSICETCVKNAVEILEELIETDSKIPSY